MTNRLCDIEKILLANIKKDSRGCWRWQRKLKTGVTGGYGAIRVSGKTQLVHRLAFWEWNGPIPDGMFVCHWCNVRCCINPMHIYVGSQKENMRDMDQAGRRGTPKGAAVWTNKLSPTQVRAIRKLLADNVQHWRIAEMFGVTRSAITTINRGVSWKHLV